MPPSLRTTPDAPLHELPPSSEEPPEPLAARAPLEHERAAAGPFTQLKRVLVGRPLPSDRLEHERLHKRTALAVLSSDAISSVAYATEQILLVLAVLSTAALQYVLPISAVIVGLLVLVALSYRQTIFAYPNGGGSYTVAKDSLGIMPGLVAAAALLTDYILTVAVSISSGVAAITSAYPPLAAHTVLLCVASIGVLMLVNLRGVRESGAVFSIPTYVFIVLMVVLIALGIGKAFAGAGTAVIAGPPRIDVLSARQHGAQSPLGFAFVFLLLRAHAERQAHRRACRVTRRESPEHGPGKIRDALGDEVVARQRERKRRGATGTLFLV